MPPIVTADEIREMDRQTIEDLGVPGVVLMENAGRAVFEVVLDAYADGDGGPVAILCGAGNNGGDGYVVARHLHQLGVPCAVYLAAPRERIQGDARINLDILDHLPVPIWELETDGEALDVAMERASVLVDALLGTGLNSEVRGRYRDIIEQANTSGAFKVAVDIPSGIRADDGALLGVAFEADVTVTFGAPKRGLALRPGADAAGEIIVADIGIPPQVVDAVDPKAELIDWDELVDAVPRRARDGHKGRYGHVLVIAGGPGKAGASLLAGQGALHTGAGLVTVAVPAAVQPSLEGRVPELMVTALPEDEADLVTLLQGKSAIAIGPGLGNSAESAALVRLVLSEATCPLVVDADGLNALAREPGAFAQAAQGCVLTPHPGEMARLLDGEVPEVQADRVGSALALAAREQAVVVLKGAPSLVAEPGGRLAINTSGNPGMGSAGSGDVLTGMLAALVAQGLPLVEAARVAAFLHGVAGDEAAEVDGERGLTASALIASVGPVLAEAEAEFDAC